MELVWYVAYGSNLCRDRFLCYLRGGRPALGNRDYPGCRNPQDPQADLALTIPGGLRFVGESTVWGGGLAVFDAAADTELAARAYLITAGQFADVVAQETRTEPGFELDLTPVTETGTHTFGPGHYQTLTHVGTHEGRPLLTFTSRRPSDLVDNAPSAGYLRTIATGLAESHGWSRRRIGSYLAGFPGAAGTWTAEAIAVVAA